MNFTLFFWPCSVVYRILFPWPGIEPMSPALGAQSLKHWRAKEVSEFYTLMEYWSHFRSLFLLLKSHCIISRGKYILFWKENKYTKNIIFRIQQNVNTFLIEKISLLYNCIKATTPFQLWYRNIKFLCS